MATLHRLREQYQKELALAEKNIHNHDDDIDHDHFDDDDDVDHYDADNDDRESVSSSSSSLQQSSSHQVTATTPTQYENDDNDGDDKFGSRTTSSSHQSPKDVRSLVAFPPTTSISTQDDTVKASNKRKRIDDDDEEPTAAAAATLYDPLNPDEADEQSLADLLSDCCPTNDFTSLLDDDDSQYSEQQEQQQQNDYYDGEDDDDNERLDLVRAVSAEDYQDHSPSSANVPVPPPPSVLNWDIRIVGSPQQPERTTTAATQQSNSSTSWDVNDLYCQPLSMTNMEHDDNNNWRVNDDGDELPLTRKRARMVE
jgi:hypothetical protein